MLSNPSSSNLTLSNATCYPTSHPTCCRTWGTEMSHTAQMGYSDVIWVPHLCSAWHLPRGHDETLEGLKNPDALNLGIFLSLYVYKICVNMLKGGMGSWTICFFSSTFFPFRKGIAKGVKVTPRTRIDIDLSSTAPQSRVLNYCLK